MKKARVVVYSRGLMGSLAFKLGEYFAASRCIVAEETSFRVPEPWVDGREMAFFGMGDGAGGADEAVRRVRELVDDEPAALAMAEAAHRYYERAVKPEAAMRGILATAMGR